MIVDGEEVTDHGGLVNCKARKQFKCELESCTEPILPGTEYWGLVTAHSKQHVFTRKFHQECLLPYVFSKS